MQNGWLYTVCSIHTIPRKILFFFKKRIKIKFCPFLSGFNCDAAKRTRQQYHVKVRVFYSCSQHCTWFAFSVAGTSKNKHLWQERKKKKVLPCLTEKEVQVPAIHTSTSFELFLRCHDLKFCRSLLSKNNQKIKRWIFPDGAEGCPQEIQHGRTGMLYLERACHAVTKHYLSSK